MKTGSNGYDKRSKGGNKITVNDKMKATQAYGRCSCAKKSIVPSNRTTVLTIPSVSRWPYSAVDDSSNPVTVVTLAYDNTRKVVRPWMMEFLIDQVRLNIINILFALSKHLRGISALEFIKQFVMHGMIL